MPRSSRADRDVFSLELADIVAVQQELQEALFADGWVRHGWPEALGGLGGDTHHHAVVYDELGRRRVPIPESYLTVETLGPDAERVQRIWRSGT